MRTARLFLVASLAACSHSAGESIDSRIASVQLVGAVFDPKGANFIRDGASSGPLGGKILYAFGDTLLFTKSIDGQQLRTNTAAYAELSAPTLLSEPLDTNGTPFQFIPFTAAELAYNVASGRPDERFAIWPGSLIPHGDGNAAFVVFNDLKVHPGTLNYEEAGMGLAEVKSGETTATRFPGFLFSAPEPGFVHAAVQKDGWVYVYACTVSAQCSVARVPLEAMPSRASYTFWDGRQWQAELALAALVVPGSTSGFSVSYNAHLGAFLSFTTVGLGSGDVHMRTAQAPQGPWSDPTRVFSFPSGVYATNQHVALDRNGGQVVFVSAYRSTGDFQGAIELLQVTFR